MLTLSAAEKQLKNIVNLAANLKSIWDHVEQQDMLDCFMFGQHNGSEVIKSDVIILIKQYQSATED
eukprot:7428108-Ditylum_brightwellii.AAC.2